MSTNWDLPERGVVFWPVGNGDSITIALDAETVIQVDVNHRTVAEDDDDPRVPVVDRLAAVLPTAADGKTPRLAVLAITHHDEDHCSGAERVVTEFQVDELWLTLRSFVEDKNNEGLHDEGKALYKEALRRRDAEIAADAKGERAAPGDRLRIIGYHDLLKDDDWVDFPEDLVKVPGNFITTINTEERDDVDVFIHTPFHSDTNDGSRNSSSLGIQVTLNTGTCVQRFLLLGDLEYAQIEAFVERSTEAGNEEQLEWDYLLAPHHCSRNAIRKLVDGKWVNADAYDMLKEHAEPDATIIASSRQFGEQSDDDTNPPHDDARTEYVKIVGESGFLCTADVAEGSDSEPITIIVTESDCGERRTRAAYTEKLASLGVATGATIRAGDTRTGTGDREFAAQ